ncbi:hypothetical protein AB0K48_52100 [Nonomuraea sp. NPDC055795]
MCKKEIIGCLKRHTASELYGLITSNDQNTWLGIHRDIYRGRSMIISVSVVLCIPRSFRSRAGHGLP